MNARREIQQMRADVDALAKKKPRLADGEFEVYTLAHPEERTMKIRLRRLHVGEPRRRGDLQLHPEIHRLVPLILPWWKRYGVVTDDHVDHFRILP